MANIQVSVVYYTDINIQISNKGKNTQSSILIYSPHFYN